MNVQLIIFSLKEQSKDDIINRIKTRWTWARLTSDAWCIKTDKESSEIRDELCVGIGKEERIFIADITDSSWGSFNLPEEVNGWLK